MVFLIISILSQGSEGDEVIEQQDPQNYRKRGKIRWAKHLRFQPYEVFRGNTFTVHWPPVFITYV